VGGSFACGDAGSLFGNEGLRGIFRQSSDDPATLYCFIDPSIVHPSYNTAWSNPQCIHIVKNNTLLPFADYAADPSNHEILNMNYSVPDHSPISSSNEATGIPVVPGWSMHGSTGDRSPSEAEILEAITNCVTMAAVEYHRVPGSLRERHGEKGEERAQALKEKFSAIQTLSAINKELAILFEEKGLFDFRSKGNYHEGSLKTLVLKKLKANDIAKNYIWAKPESNHSELPKDQAGREACAASSNILRPKKK